MRTRQRSLLELVIVCAVLASGLSVMTVAEAVDAGWWPKLFVLARMAVLVLICTWLLRRGGERWADVGLRRPPRWWSVPLLVAGGFVVALVVSAFAGTLLEGLAIDAPRHPFEAIQGELLEYLYWAGPVAWGSAAFGEELVLRGFVLDRLAKVLGSYRTPALLAGIVVQAAVFGSLHFYQGPGGVIVTGVLGALYGLVWLVGGRNLWACIALHGLINSVAFYDSFTTP